MGTNSPSLKIHSKAPTRIDLAGGTLDLWPLYLFLDRPTTVNVGIDLFAEAWLDAEPGNEITLRSEDQNFEMKVAWPDLATAHAPPQLELHLKLLRFVAAKYGKTGGEKITLRTRANSPAGAGLGGSSTLSIAIVGALASWARGGARADYSTEGEQWIEIVRDVETTVIQVPAGVQDYYGAMFGGLQSLRWGHGSHEHDWFDRAILPEVESRIALFYSGQSRNSGINNWALFKGFIDKQAEVRERFGKINAATHALEKALRARDWKAACDAIGTEWTTRRTLAAGITTPEIDQAFEAAARAARSPISGKICGAGGGGCFFVYCTDPADKAAVEKAVAALGKVRVLPFRAVPHGLDVQVNRA